ncbi:VanZ family protein [Marisediminicola sp. LYQ85]|uniref:VanZ family protein n=1 Tax=Marisediminicola sp. LYQ85 TaxID=3391062 RepID=UPI003983464A
MMTGVLRALLVLWAIACVLAILVPVPLDLLMADDLSGWARAQQLVAYAMMAARFDLLTNVLMFVVLGCLLALCSRARFWLVTPIYCFQFSVLIEVVQFFFLDRSFASWLHVVANLVGGVLGAYVVHAARERRAKRSLSTSTEVERFSGEQQSRTGPRP